MRFSHHTIKAGTTGTSLLVFLARDDGARSGMTGLRHDAPRATAAYVRLGEAGAHRVDLSEGTLGEHRPGAFVEVDPELLPGVYQFGVPDEALTPGSARAVLMLSFPGAVAEPVEIALVAYDPQDPERIGVEGLSDSRRLFRSIVSRNHKDLSGENAVRIMNVLAVGLID